MLVKLASDIKGRTYTEAEKDVRRWICELKRAEEGSWKKLLKNGFLNLYSFSRKQHDFWSFPLLLHTAPLLLHTASLLLHTTPLLLHTAPLLLHTTPLLVHTTPLLVHTTPLSVQPELSIRLSGNLPVSNICNITTSCLSRALLKKLTV
jgi:hypothetical protein